MEGGAQPEIENTAEGGSAKARADGVNALGREHEACGVEIGGGEAECAAEAVAGDNVCVQGVGATQEACGGGEIAPAYQVADPS